MKNFFINLIKVFKISPLSLLFISFVSLAISLTEIISLGVFQVFLISILDNTNISNKLTFSFLKNIEPFIFNSYEISILFLLMFFFILKNIFQIFLNYKFFSYIENRHRELLNKFFKVMLLQDYLEITKEKSTKYNQLVSRYAETFVKHVLGGTVKIFSEAIFLVCIIFYLLSLDFNLIISILVVLIFFLILHNLFIKNYLTKNSARISKTEEILKNNIYEYIKNFREILIFNLKSSMLSKFLNSSNDFTRFEKKYLFVSSLARNIFEILFIFFIGIYFMGFTNNDKLNEELPILITVIFALMRLMPSINIINHSLAVMSQHSYDYFELKKYLSGNLENKNIEIKFNEIKDIKNDSLSKIELKNLTYYYEKSKFIIQNLNLLVNLNETVLIKGKSGSGKSTLVDLITNIIKPSSGNVNFFDKENKKIKFNNFGFVFQNPTLFSNTLKYNLAFKHDLNNTEEKNLINLINLSDLNLKNIEGNILEHIINEDGKNLSGGQLKKISLIRTMFADPTVIILDEITANLDDKSSDRIINIINNNRKNKIFFIISHKEEKSLKYDKIINLDEI